jgi:hypothetical protein
MENRRFSEVNPRVLNPWQVVKVGSFSKKDLCNQMMTAFKVSRLAHDMLNEISVSSKIEKVRLVIVSAKDLLGFNFRTDKDSFYALARTFSLGVCHNEIAPLLRRQYLNQPGGECLQIAMNPINGSNFVVQNVIVGDKIGDQGLMLNHDYDSDVTEYDKWVFEVLNS